MRIAVMGTGGLGGYIGGRLAHTGLDVTFIARGENLAVMSKDGLRVHSPYGDFAVKPVKATDDPARAGAADLVLFCVKSYDALSAAEMIRPLVGLQTVILPVLNGIDHVDQIAAAVGAEHVLGGITLINAHRTAPGLFEQVGQSHSLEFGEMAGSLSRRCEMIRQTLAASGIQFMAVPNIVERMWWKLALVCGAGVFSAARGDKGRIWSTPEIPAIVRQLVAEVVAVAHAKQIALPTSLPGETVALFDSDPSEYKPSMLVDLERGNRLEVEATHGAVVRLGKELRVPTPANNFVYACLKPYVNGSLSTDH